MEEGGRGGIGSVEYESDGKDKDHSQKGEQLAEHSEAAYNLLGDDLADVDRGHSQTYAREEALYHSKGHEGPYVLNVDYSSHYKGNQVGKQRKLP